MDTAIGCFAVLVTATIACFCWPKTDAPRRRKRGPRVEGPPHPYRRPGRVDREPHQPMTWTVRLDWSDAERRAMRALDHGSGERRFRFGAHEVYPATLLDVAVRIGRVDDAIAIVEAIHARSPDPDLAFVLARAAAAVGDRSRAEAWLTEAAKLGFRDIGRLLDEPSFAPLLGRDGMRLVLARVAS